MPKGKALSAPWPIGLIVSRSGPRGDSLALWSEEGVNEAVAKLQYFEGR
jgi:hypothetical protein